MKSTFLYFLSRNNIIIIIIIPSLKERERGERGREGRRRCRDGTEIGVETIESEYHLDVNE